MQLDKDDNTTEPGTIVIRRLSSGPMASLREFRILVDGKYRGMIYVDNDFKISLPPGTHQVQLRIDWCGSKIISVPVHPDSTTYIYCRINRNSVWNSIFAIN